MGVATEIKNKLPIEDAFEKGGEDVLVLWSSNAGNAQSRTREAVARLVCGAMESGGENVWFGFGDFSGMTKKDGTPQCSRIGELDSWLGQGALASAKAGPKAFGAFMDSAMGHQDFSCFGRTDLAGLLVKAGEHTNWRPRTIIFASTLEEQTLEREKMPREAGDWLSLCDVFVALPEGASAVDEPSRFFGSPCAVKRMGVFDAGTLCDLSTALALKKSLETDLPLGAKRRPGLAL